jgi:hypothetical protein
LEKNAISAGRIAQPPHSRVQLDFIEPNFVEVFLLFGWCRKQVIEFAGGGCSLLRTSLGLFDLLFRKNHLIERIGVGSFRNPSMLIGV